MKRIALKAALAIAGISILTACGGGGSSGGGSAAGPTLNLNAAYSSMITNGSSAIFTLSGDCIGTSVQTKLPAYARGTYDVSPVSVISVDSIQKDTISSASPKYSVCTEIYNSQNNQIYDSFYNPTTKTIVNKGYDPSWSSISFYDIYANQAPLPTSVTAGSSGVIYTYKDFNGASSTTGTPKQTGTYSYSVAADSATTLLVTFTRSGNDGTSGKALFTDSTTYRLNANNTLTPLSLAIATTADLTGVGVSSVSGVAASTAPTLNAGAARITQLSSASNTTFNLLRDSSQCGTVGMNAAAINSSMTAVSNYTTNITDNSCQGFSMPSSITTVYGSAYQVLTETTVGLNFGAPYTTVDTATNTPASSPLPNNVTVGAAGTLYNYTRDLPSGTTGKVTYFVGANSSSALTLYEMNTVTDSNGFVTRYINASNLSGSNVLTPAIGYIDNTFTLVAN